MNPYLSRYHVAKSTDRMAVNWQELYHSCQLDTNAKCKNCKIEQKIVDNSWCMDVESIFLRVEIEKPRKLEERINKKGLC